MTAGASQDNAQDSPEDDWICPSGARPTWGHVLGAHLTRFPEARTSSVVHVRDLSGPGGASCGEGIK